ncbi:hypothetical protein DXC92_04485 [Clostridiales bacterium TF09-2AC]|nr:hypothetical protein DXC92_04485 [Clostridiales bacterium TF09-2AC]
MVEERKEYINAKRTASTTQRAIQFLGFRIKSRIKKITAFHPVCQDEGGGPFTGWKGPTCAD